MEFNTNDEVVITKVDSINHNRHGIVRKILSVGRSEMYIVFFDSSYVGDDWNVYYRGELEKVKKPYIFEEVPYLDDVIKGKNENV